MAIEKLKSRFNAELDKSINRLYGGYAKGLGSRVVVNFILGGTSAVADFIKGTSKVMDQMQVGFDGEDESTFNNTSSWTNAIETTNKKIKQDRKIGRYKLRTYKEGRGKIPSAGGVYLGEPLSSGNLRLDLILYAKNNSGTEAQVQNIWDSYTKKVWTTWISQQFPGMEAGQTSFTSGGASGMMRTEDSITRQNSKKKLVQQSAISAFRLNTKKEHAMGSTRALFALKDLENSNPPLHDNIVMQTTDVIEYIKDNLQVDITQNTARTKVGKYEFDNIVELKLGSNPQLRSDRGNIKALAEEFIRQEVETGKYNNVFGHDKEGSKSPKQQVLEDAIIDLFTPLTKSGKPDMRFKQNKKFKKTRKSVNVKKQSDTGSIVTKTVGVSKAISATRPQKEKRQTQENTQKLKAYINRKLPAQIRRNMGKSGVLTNRSGTFSNSPQLLNIRETQTGLTGDYTYMKTGGGTPPRSGQPGVYQTFENSGRWNGKYNPKDLITKSIRELARQETTQRFVQLRRK